jgi:Protein of unknown function DUF2834
MGLLIVAAFGLLVPNAIFVHWILTDFTTVEAVLADRLAVSFILDALIAMVLVAWLFALAPRGPVRWPWFVVLSLLGGLGFSIPFYLWLNRRLDPDPKATFAEWWRSR